MTTKVLKLVFMILISINLVKSSTLLCADKNCKEIIAEGRTLNNYYSPENKVLSLPANKVVKIYGKLQDNNRQLFLLEIGEKRGYAPSSFIQELKIVTRNLIEVSPEKFGWKQQSINKQEETENKAETKTSTAIPSSLNSDGEVLQGSTVKGSTPFDPQENLTNGITNNLMSDRSQESSIKNEFNIDQRSENLKIQSFSEDKITMDDLNQYSVTHNNEQDMQKESTNEKKTLDSEQPTSDESSDPEPDINIEHQDINFHSTITSEGGPPQPSPTSSPLSVPNFQPSDNTVSSKNTVNDNIIETVTESVPIGRSLLSTVENCKEYIVIEGTKICDDHNLAQKESNVANEQTPLFVPYNSPQLHPSTESAMPDMHSVENPNFVTTNSHISETRTSVSSDSLKIDESMVQNLEPSKSVDTDQLHSTAISSKTADGNTESVTVSEGINVNDLKTSVPNISTNYSEKANEESTLSKVVSYVTKFLSNDEEGTSNNKDEDMETGDDFVDDDDDEDVADDDESEDDEDNGEEYNEEENEIDLQSDNKVKSNAESNSLNSVPAENLQNENIDEINLKSDETQDNDKRKSNIANDDDNTSNKEKGTEDLNEKSENQNNMQSDETVENLSEQFDKTQNDSSKIESDEQHFEQDKQDIENSLLTEKENADVINLKDNINTGSSTEKDILPNKNQLEVKDEETSKKEVTRMENSNSNSAEKDSSPVMETTDSSVEDANTKSVESALDQETEKTSKKEVTNSDSNSAENDSSPIKETTDSSEKDANTKSVEFAIETDTINEQNTKSVESDVDVDVDITNPEIKLVKKHPPSDELMTNSSQLSDSSESTENVKNTKLPVSDSNPVKSPSVETENSKLEVIPAQGNSETKNEDDDKNLVENKSDENSKNITKVKTESQNEDSVQQIGEELDNEEKETKSKEENMQDEDVKDKEEIPTDKSEDTLESSLESEVQNINESPKIESKETSYNTLPLTEDNSLSDIDQNQHSAHNQNIYTEKTVYSRDINIDITEDTKPSVVDSSTVELTSIPEDTDNDVINTRTETSTRSILLYEDSNSDELESEKTQSTLDFISNEVTEYANLVPVYLQVIIDVLPEGVQKQFSEWEKQGLSPRVTIVTVIASISTFLVCVLTVFIQRRSKESHLIGKLVAMEQKMFTVSTEKDVLKEEVDTTKRQVLVLQKNLFEQRNLVTPLQTELDETKIKNKELETSVEALMCQIEMFQRNAITLQNLADAREEKSTELLQKLEENEKITAELERNLQQVQMELSEAEEGNEKLKSSNEQLTTQVHQLEKSCNQLLQEAQLWNERVNELTGMLEVSKESCQELQNTIKLKETETEGLKNTLQELKIMEEMTSSEEGNEKLQKLLDVSLVQEQLREVKNENNTLHDKVITVNEMLEQKEASLLESNNEVEKLKQNYNQALQDKMEAQTKLDVLSNYFKEKEMQLQKELGAQEAMRQQKEEDVSSASRRIALIDQENVSYKHQLATLKQELEETERNYKNQVAMHEKKAHENWLAARAAERKLDDVKQEASQLRQRLTLLEREQEVWTKSQMDGLVRPVPKRYLEPGREMPYTTQPNNSQQSDSADISSSSVACLPSSHDIPELNKVPVSENTVLLPVDRPLPPTSRIMDPRFPLPPPPFMPPFGDHLPPPPPPPPPPYLDPWRFPPPPLPPMHGRMSPPEYDRRHFSPPLQGTMSPYEKEIDRHSIISRDAIDRRLPSDRYSSPPLPGSRDSHSSSPPHMLPRFHDNPPLRPYGYPLPPPPLMTPHYPPPSLRRREPQLHFPPSLPLSTESDRNGDPVTSSPRRSHERTLPSDAKATTAV